MDSNALPTKRNLLQAKHNLILAKKGHDLLDMRYKALLHELVDTRNIASKLREKLRRKIIIAYQSLAIAQIEMEHLEDFWKKYFWNKNMTYELSDTCASWDEAFISWQGILNNIEELATVEAEIYRLIIRIKRTQKRAASLRNVTIPNYEARVKYISEQLEEKERDELIRLKVSKEKRGKS